MVWTSDIDVIVEAGRDIKASYFLHILNGYDLIEEEDHTIIRIQNNGWATSLVEGAPSISTLRLKPGYVDFKYFEEFTHSNPFQLFTDVKLECVIYKFTTTALAGTISISQGSNMVTGYGTAFNTDLQHGDIVLITGAETHPIMVRRVVNNFLFEAYQVSPLTLPAAPPPGVAYSMRDSEHQFIFRGLIEDKQLQNMDLNSEAFDYLVKLNFAKVIIDEEADHLGPYTDATMRHAAAFDPVAPIEYYTYEVDPVAAGQAWAEDIFGNNRAFVPGVFEIEQLIGAVWTEIAASEYMVDTPYGIIRFYNDQGIGAQFRIKSVEVYQEGTLELADIYETMLRYPAICPDLGPGFGDDKLQIEFPIGQTITTAGGGPPYVVTGIGTDFQNDLEVGDRIAFLGSPLDFMVVSWIHAAAQTLHLKYPAAAAGPFRFVKSTLMESEICLSNLRWDDCQGSAGDLLRKLREFYADSKGYRVFYDHFEDKIRGRRVAINTTTFKTLGPKVDLRTNATAENFASAIEIKYTLGRAQNLITQPGVTITELATGLPLVGDGWNLGTSPGTMTTWGGMYWSLADPPASDYINDTELASALMVYRAFSISDPDVPIGKNEYDFIHIDFGAAFDLSTIYLYAPNCKNPMQFSYGISIHKSDVGMNDLGPLLPSTYQLDINPDEQLTLDCSLATNVQYLLVRMRPIKWNETDQDQDHMNRSMGLREMIIFGSATACETVCIQGEKAPCNPVTLAGLTLMTGTATFNAGGPPYTVTGAGGSLFTAEFAVGDAMCVAADTVNFGFIRRIINDTSLELLLPYGGVGGTNGNVYRCDNPFSPNPANCYEGQGGHFIGGDLTNFVTDYYPELMAKMYHTTHRLYQDDSGVVFSEPQAIDRGYLILDEMIRMYREILWKGAFDPRFLLYDTAYTTDAYRDAAGPETLYFMVEAISLSESGVSLSGREYSAGVLE